MKKTRSSVVFLASLVGFCTFPLHAADSVKATTPVAKIGNTILTEDDLKKDTGMSLYEAENALYELKKNWVDQKAKNILFDQAAKEAGLSRQAWQTREIDGKITPVAQQEIDQLAPRFGVQGSTVPPSDAEYARMKEQAKQYLAGQRRTQVENSVYQQLVQKN